MVPTTPPIDSSLSMCAPDASQDFNNHRVRRADLATGATTTLAGSGAAGFRDGDGASAQFSGPYSVAIAPSGNFALVVVRAQLVPARHAIPRSPQLHTASL